jgi:hypothetical protein
MKSFNPLYRKFIDDKHQITPTKMVRGKFYQIKTYEYVDGHKGRYTELNAPIIYTLFVSQLKDVVHAIKVTNVRPELIRKFFGKFVNEDTEKLQIKGGAKQFYSQVVSKIPIITNDSYRTYKLSGFDRIIELNMEISNLVPATKKVTGIDPDSQKRNL